MNPAILTMLKHIAVVAAFAAVAAGASAAGLLLGALDPTTAALVGSALALFVRLADAELSKIDPSATPPAVQP